MAAYAWVFHALTASMMYGLICLALGTPKTGFSALYEQPKIWLWVIVGPLIFTGAALIFWKS